MKVKGFEHFGGKHWETAAMKNTLAHAGVVAPHSKQPLSEAMCLGIAGGITAGYSFCPSIPGHETGSGVTAVGRHRVYVTSGAYHEDFFKRLGAVTTIKETTSLKTAHNNLVEALSADKPAIAWCSPMRITFLGWGTTCGMYATVVFGVDEAKGEAYLGDRAPTPVTVPLEDLSWARNRVCSHRNRILTFEAPKKLSAQALKDAVLEGIRACADDFLHPKLKSFSLPGLLEWSKLVANPKNKRGWPQVFPDGTLYLALRDVFDSIETAGTGGGLFRPMYADFLEEAAEVTRKSALKQCANQYRALADQWRETAEAALPAKVKPFKQTQELLRKRCRVFEEKGAPGMKDVHAATRKLTEIEAEVVDRFPLDADQRTALLEDLGRRLHELHEAETAAARALAAAVA